MRFMNFEIVNAKNLKMDINKQGKSIMFEYFANCSDLCQ